MLKLLYIAYILMIPLPNTSDLITGGLVVKNSTEKCPKKLKTIKYQLSCALRGAAPPQASLRHHGVGGGECII